MEKDKVKNDVEPIETVNRSRAYLIFIFREYGSVFYNTLVKERASVINLYIRDLEYEDFNDIDYLKTPLIYVRIKESHLVNAKDFFKAMKSSRFYRSNYIHSFSNEERIFVFDIKPSFHNAYYCFLRSEYSKMYNKEQLKSIGLPKIRSGEISPAYCVLHGLPDRYDFYQAIVMNKFNVPITAVAPLEALKEYDIPIDMMQESLNYRYEPRQRLLNKFKAQINEN